MKRFTATEKWQDAWFRKLEPRLKCLWQYLCDNCDHAGVIDPDWDLIGFQIGEDVSLSDIPKFGQRVVQLPSGKFWIASFIEFQYGTLSHACQAHNPVYKAMLRHGIPESYQGLIDRLCHTLPNTLSDRVKDKDKEEDKDVDQGELLKGEPPPEPESPPQPNRASRLNRLFNRRDTTKWSDKETRAYRQGAELCPVDEFEIVEAYYLSGGKYLRRDLFTLLNNWNGEVDRARQWKLNPNADSGRNSAQNHRGITGAEQRQVGIPATPRIDLEKFVG